MKKRLWKQITAIIMVCVLITGMTGINTNAALAANNRKNTAEENGIKENISKEEKSPELDMILRECEEIKTGKTSTEIRKGDIMSVSSVSGDVTRLAIMSNGDLYCWGYNEYGQIGNGTTKSQLTPYKVLSGVKSVTYSSSSPVAAITENGDLYCWGYNEFGQVGNGTIKNQFTPYKVLSEVKSVTYSSPYSVAAITENGDLYCWGNNRNWQVGNGTENNYQLTPYKVLTGVKSIIYSEQCVSAITEEGDLYCWGSNKCGQVGNGTTNKQLIPYKVLSGIKSVTFHDCGYNTCFVSAIMKNGDLYCWGSNGNGQVGNGTTTNQLIPIKVLSRVKSIASYVSYYSSKFETFYYWSISAITENGDLYCWGYNGNGQAGNGTTTNQLIPYKVLSKVKSVTYSYSTSYHSPYDPYDKYSSVSAITESGDLYCWGFNGDGHIGNGTTTNQLVPYKVLSRVKFVTYSYAYYRTSSNSYMYYCSVFAITENGDLYCWGDNINGQVGNGTTTNQLVPIKVLSEVKFITFFYSHYQANSACLFSVSAITENGDLYCWGANGRGQIGNGTTTSQLIPYKVLNKVKFVTCSSYSYFPSMSAITENGDLYCWGDNINGQVGNGTTTNQLTPYKVLSGVKSVTYSYYSSYHSPISAITEDGDLYCWGNNNYGQVGNGTTENQLTPFKVSFEDSSDDIARFTLSETANATLKDNDNSFTFSGHIYLEDGKTASSEEWQSIVNSINWTSSDTSVVTDIKCQPVTNGNEQGDIMILVSVSLKSAGEATVTGTTRYGLSSSCDITVEEEKKEKEIFDDAIYRANWLLGQETLLDLAMNGEQTSAEIIYNEAEASGLSTSSEAWQLLQDMLGAILDDPSGLLDKPLEKEQLYEGIIFAMFDASADITIFPGENQAKKAVKETNSLLSLLKNVFKTKYDVDIADAFDAISLKPEYQKALHDTSEEYFKNLGISKASKFLSKINKAVTCFNDFEDYLKYEMDCMALMELGESYRDIIQAMYDACSWGNHDLKLALLDCVNIMDDTMEDLVTKIAAGTFISAGVSTVKVGIQTIWNDAKTQVVVSNPYVAIIWGSYKASTYFADKVFGASSIAEKTVKLGALNDIKPLTFAVYQDAKKAFENDRSKENAENYLAALDVAYRYLDQDCGTAKSFAETTSSTLAARLMSLFGADDKTDTVLKIGSIQNLYSNDFEILNIGWLYDLEVDYPDEYPNYEYLMTDWEKKYLVSCPVDVYVYDKNENLVASSVGNMPYVADDSKFTVSVLGDRKTIYSYENMDSYTFKYVSTGMGTMDVTIEENNRSNDYPRIVKHVGVPLAEGVSYKSLDDMASSSNSYELETVENSHILKPSFDSANNVSMKYKLSVSNGFLLNEGQVGIEGDFLTGEKISIYASVPKGYVFKEWVSNGEVVFENASALSTTVIMPNYAVVITATYESAGNDNGNSSSPSPSPSTKPSGSSSPSPSSSTKPSGTGTGSNTGSGGGGASGGGGTSGGTGGGGGAIITPTSTPVATLTPSPSPTIEPSSTPVITTTTKPSQVTNTSTTPTPKPSASTTPGTGSDSIFNNNSKKEITYADVTLNKKSVIYNGKEKKPGVTVLGSSLELIKDKDYTVSYSNNINVGTAYVTVYGEGNYYGSVTKSFKIIPKGTPVRGKVKPKHKGFTVKWKKQPKSITGYQVQYSTSKKFKGKITVIRTVKKKSITKLTAGKLKAKKKYYVRVRTYKTVKGKKYYSRWSKSKVVKTKK